MNYAGCTMQQVLSFSSQSRLIGPIGCVVKAREAQAHSTGQRNAGQVTCDPSCSKGMGRSS